MKVPQRLIRAILVILGIALFAVNIALIRKNRDLTTRLNAKFGSLMAAPGTSLPPLRGARADGQDIIVGWDGKHDSLVMVFSVSCEFCEQNWPRWSSLVGKIDREQVNPVLVDITGRVTEGFLLVHKIQGLPLVQHVDPGFITTYDVLFVPETILVDPNGRVIKVWAGILQPQDEADILRMCHDQVSHKA